MKFVVKRTSGFYSFKSKKPIIGSTVEEVEHRDDSKEKDSVSVCNFNTLEDLMNFVEEHGDIIIFKQSSYTIPEIEIYDDYRE